MAKLTTNIKFSEVEPIKALLKTLVDHIDELPDPVVKAMQEVADCASEEK